MKPSRSRMNPVHATSYPSLLRALVALLEEARRASARTVNVIMTATYWRVGRHIVEFEQAGKRRAGYGQQLLGRLSRDLTKRFGRGFSVDQLELMRLIYNTYPLPQISETMSRKLPPATTSGISESPVRKSSATLIPVNSESVIRKFTIVEWSQVFPLSWTHYVHLLRRSRSPEARAFSPLNTGSRCHRKRPSPPNSNKPAAPLRPAWSLARIAGMRNGPDAG